MDSFDGMGRAKRERWTGSRALVPLPRDACVECGGEVQTMSWSQLALFYHGGYGAALTSTLRWCPCGAHRIVEVQETNPRSVA